MIDFVNSQDFQLFEVNHKVVAVRRELDQIPRGLIRQPDALPRIEQASFDFHNSYYGLRVLFGIPDFADSVDLLGPI